MSDVVIRAEGLGKRYHIGERNRGMFRYGSLRDSLASFFTRRSPQQAGQSETIWALKDVSFEIKRGEVVGIIGRNGAGKSTLLKILSRITEPTEGFAEIHGRVGSLLEVGTGFHPELTGRENIFLNGAILGMRKAEIAEKFDEIVAFAEVEKFIDTPVKHYSSGMYVRLAFAVAAHMETEVLLVDEVLAVGDGAFRRKCLDKMDEVAKEGRTVLLVSHNMSVITNLCTTAVHLIRGQGNPKTRVEEAVAEYSKDVGSDRRNQFPVERDEIIIHGFRVSQGGAETSECSAGLPVQIEIDFELRKPLDHFRIGYFLKTSTGELISRVLLADWMPQYQSLQAGRYRASTSIPADTLTGVTFVIQPHCSRYGIKDYCFDEEISRRISVCAPSDFNRAHLGERSFGFILIRSEWFLSRQ